MLVKNSGRRVQSLFNQLDRRLKNTDKKGLFIIGLSGGQRRDGEQRRRRRGGDRKGQTTTDQSVAVLLVSPSKTDHD